MVEVYAGLDVSGCYKRDTHAFPGMRTKSVYVPLS